MTPPYDQPVNLLTQSILTFGSWGLTLVFLIIALRFCLKEKTPFYLLVMIAAMVAAFAEPLYDEGMDLLFYVPGIWSHFTAYDIPQPNWTHSGYAVLYGSAAMYIGRQIHLGQLTRSAIWMWAGIEFLMSCSFEMIGINGGAYEYWGPHELRVLNYPIAIGILESAQVITFAVLAAKLREHSKSSLNLLWLLLLFPCTFYLANFGAGSPLVIALHLENTTRPIVFAATILSIIGAFGLVRLVSMLLPETRTTTAPAHKEA
ncbi:MAG: hypothetical protein ACRBEQ_10705 [Hyphomonas sp.]